MTGVSGRISVNSMIIGGRQCVHFMFSNCHGPHVAVAGKARSADHTFLTVLLGFSPPRTRALLDPVQSDAVGKSQKSLSCRVCVVASGTDLKKII